jgi:hypothetical protein
MAAAAAEVNHGPFPSRAGARPLCHLHLWTQPTYKRRLSHRCKIERVAMKATRKEMRSMRTGSRLYYRLPLD